MYISYLRMSTVTGKAVMKKQSVQADGQNPIILLAISLHEISARNIKI
jgi:hypothetical protein